MTVEVRLVRSGIDVLDLQLEQAGESEELRREALCHLFILINISTFVKALISSNLLPLLRKKVQYHLFLLVIHGTELLFKNYIFLEIEYFFFLILLCLILALQ